MLTLLHEFSFLQTLFVRHPSRIRHNGDKGADVQQGPAQRFLFRLSPCVNLLYCLLLLNIPWVLNTPTGDTGVIGIFATTDQCTYLEIQGQGRCFAQYML